MATAETVKAKLTGLIEQANTTTGGGAATLTDAVAALVAGFGAGGGSSGVGVESGTFIPSEDVSDFSVDVPQTIRDNCFYISCVCDLNDASELVESGTVCAATIAMMDDAMYLSDVNDIARYATLRRWIGELPATSTSANRYTMGIYKNENKILIGSSVATRPFRAGVRYYYNICYTEGANV